MRRPSDLGVDHKDIRRSGDKTAEEESDERDSSEERRVHDLKLQIIVLYTFYIFFANFTAGRHMFSTKR